MRVWCFHEVNLVPINESRDKVGCHHVAAEGRGGREGQFDRSALILRYVVPQEPALELANQEPAWTEKWRGGTFRTLRGRGLKQQKLK